jgi:hypothetical protein
VLILCDESTEYSNKIVGAVSLTVEDFYKLEDYLTRYRLNKVLFGEIKWVKLGSPGKNHECILHLIEYAMTLSSFRFHSNQYSGNQHSAQYALVRSISWKLQNAGYKDVVGILVDKIEKGQIEITKERLNYDHRFKHKINFCIELDSKSFNTLQIVDLLCGCMAYKINILNKGKQSNKCKREFITRVEQLDSSLPIDLTQAGLWGYGQKKIQHYCLVQQS